MTVSHEPVMELIRASMVPVEAKLTARKDLPACQVVLGVAKSSKVHGGVHVIHDLATGAGVAAAGMTMWLSQERGTDVDEVLARMSGEGGAGAVADLLRTLVTGEKGMSETADWLMELFHRDQDAYLDLIVDLGSYTATCVCILDGLEASRVEESLDALEDMLHEYYGR